jgi:alcohol dehydrogenase class IV
VQKLVLSALLTTGGAHCAARSDHSSVFPVRAMTLITYPTRVHFADDVLEEALRSELEHLECRVPLLICDAALADTEFYERIRDGLPPGITPLQCILGSDASLSDVARAMRIDPELAQVDAVIAFGSARAIEMGRKARRAVMDLRGVRATFFAIPGVDGLPDPCARNLESWRTGLPSVVICDPTLTLGASRAQMVRAAIVSLVRCIEGYLGPAYNPPADGMALDGFNRSIAALSEIDDASDIELRRDLMAACLNAAMAQEKGLGPTQLLSAALAAECGGVQMADAARLILPGIVGVTDPTGKKTATLLRMMEPGSDRLGGALTQVLAGIPLAPRLSEMGLTPQHLEGAARAIAGRNDISMPQAETVMRDVF